MTLINKVRENISRFPDSKFLLSCSGGPDSQAMLAAMGHIAPNRCVAVGINHGFRIECEWELDIAEKLAKQNNIPFTRIRLNLGSGPNKQHRAREARYKTLFEQMNKFDADFVVTGHHAKDRAETLLIKLLRGKNPERFRPMSLTSGQILRPMYNVTKEEVEGYLKHQRLEFAHDPSNDDANYLRSWVRHELIPMMESKNPRVVEQINQLLNTMEI